MNKIIFSNGNSISVIRDDITQLHVDAIVNAANTSLLGGGGVDGAIHRAAGPELLQACIPLNGCKTGRAKITPGFRLPASYVIHTPGPVWKGGFSGEPLLLESCYTSSLSLAEANSCSSLAFPSISTGVYGYPVDRAAGIAVRTIINFLSPASPSAMPPIYLHTVYMVCFDSHTYAAYESALTAVQSK